MNAPAENWPRYKRIPHLLQAIKNCENAGNEEWNQRHNESIAAIMATAPSGSGFDSGTELDRDRTTSRCLVFTTSFHHMNQDGYYDGWTNHTIRVWADLTFDFLITITGPNRNDIKDYINETFHHWLSSRANRES